MPTLIILASVCISSAAHILLKIGATQMAADPLAARGVAGFFAAMFNAWVIGGIALHVLALGTWIVALRRVDLSYAYPFIGLGFVIVLLGSSFLLDEKISWTRFGGVTLIVLGVVAVSRS